MLVIIITYLISFRVKQGSRIIKLIMHALILLLHYSILFLKNLFA